MAKTSAPEAGASARSAYRGPAHLSGKVAIVTGGTQGLGEAIARLFAERGAAGLVICGRNAERGERVASEISAAGCPTVFVQADLTKVADCSQRGRQGGRALRPRRCAGQRRRADRSRQYFRHHRGALQRDLRRERARAVLPHSGERAHHAPGEDRGLNRQHPVDVGPRRPAVQHRLLRLQGRARHIDPQRRPFAAQISHPCEWTQHRLDVDARRGPYPEDLPRRQGRLARGGCQGKAFRSFDRSQGSGACLRLSLLRRIRVDDRVQHRF